MMNCRCEPVSWRASRSVSASVTAAAAAPPAAAATTTATTTTTSVIKHRLRASTCQRRDTAMDWSTLPSHAVQVHRCYTPHCWLTQHDRQHPVGLHYLLDWRVPESLHFLFTDGKYGHFIYWALTAWVVYYL